MNNWINVLIVDDDRRYVTIQAENAAHHGINLIHCPYWDEAHKLIDGDPHKYDVIVLDGKGQINAASESEDINHLKKHSRNSTSSKARALQSPMSSTPATRNHRPSATTSRSSTKAPESSSFLPTSRPSPRAATPTGCGPNFPESPGRWKTACSAVNPWRCSSTPTATLRKSAPSPTSP
ncbi:MAG: hypothetical protein IPN95_29000 [Bacteroidetes bacterium]|nr:hypothetical protein [Bacteroidota bacterium]